MGYDIQFILKCPEDGPDRNEVASLLAEIADRAPPGTPSHPGSHSFWNEVLQGSTNTTWYDCEKHLAEVSARCPGRLFTLDLRGENAEDGDFWRFYFRDGMVQKEMGRIIHGEFDPEKLHAPSQDEYDITTNPIREALAGR